MSSFPMEVVLLKIMITPKNRAVFKYVIAQRVKRRLLELSVELQEQGQKLLSRPQFSSDLISPDAIA